MPGKSQNQSSRQRKQEYEEQPGWASAFFREDASGNQPKYTGTGLLDDGTEIQIGIWPKRAKTGTRYLRVHIEPAWDGSEDDEGDEGEYGDDIPY